METDDIIRAEIAATADAIRDGGDLLFHEDGSAILQMPPTTFITCTSYYNEGPCPCCSPDGI